MYTNPAFPQFLCYSARYHIHRFPPRLFTRSKTYLPRRKAPKLAILPYMRHNLDMQIVSRICYSREERSNDGGEDEELRDGRVCEARGYHRAGCRGISMSIAVYTMFAKVWWVVGAEVRS